jgi:two-component system response regulator
MISAKTILLVEDTPDDEALALRALSREVSRDQVRIARDGVEALEAILPKGFESPEATLFDLILLDLKLPKISGLEVLHKLKTHPSAQVIPTVVLSSSRELPDVLKAYQLGANSYVVKDIDLEDFTDAVSRIIRYWLLTNEPAPRHIHPGGISL